MLTYAESVDEARGAQQARGGHAPHRCSQKKKALTLATLLQRDLYYRELTADSLPQTWQWGCWWMFTAAYKMYLYYRELTVATLPQTRLWVAGAADDYWSQLAAALLRRCKATSLGGLKLLAGAADDYWS